MSLNSLTLILLLCAFNQGLTLDCYQCNSNNCENVEQLRQQTCKTGEICLSGIYQINAPRGTINSSLSSCVPDAPGLECDIIFRSMQISAQQLGGSVRQLHCVACKTNLCNTLTSSSVIYLPSIVMLIVFVTFLF